MAITCGMQFLFWKCRQNYTGERRIINWRTRFVTRRASTLSSQTHKMLPSRLPALWLLLLPLAHAFQLLQPKSLTRSRGCLHSTANSESTTLEEALNKNDRDQWLLSSLEQEERCVIGPAQVLVYDTTLRGASSRLARVITLLAK